METKIEITDAAAVALIDGRIDTVNAGDFEAALKPLTDDKVMDITLDCNKLTYISSSGLRVFLSLLKTTKSYKGQLKIQGMKPEILEIFKMTGFAAMFNII